MGQGIQDFYRVAQERDFARDFMLRVRSIGNDTFNEDDFLYITTASLPGRNIQNKQVTYMGLDINMPGTVKYEGSDNWSIQVHADRKNIIRRKFEAWNREVFDEGTSQGNLNVRGLENVIQLDLVDDKLDVLNTYKLWGVYCREIDALNYDIQGTGEKLDFNAVLTYQFWTRTRTAE